MTKNGQGVRLTHRFIGDGPAVFADILEPAGEAGQTIIMVHGGGHNGACYLTTPDGRPGWAPWFAQRGYRVVVPDWPGSGRSGAVTFADLDGALVCRALGGVLDDIGGPVVLMTHSMSGPYGWKLVESHGDKIAAVVAVAPGPPGNIQPEAEVVDRGEDWVTVERFGLRWHIPFNEPSMADDMLVRDKLIGKSARFPMHCLDAYAASLQPLAPRLIYQRQNVDGSQLKIENTAPFAGKPVLVVTGSDDTDHAREVDGAVADWLAEIGAQPEYRFLPDEGIDGNGHMLMLEDNSDEIAALIGEWIGGRIGA